MSNWIKCKGIQESENHVPFAFDLDSIYYIEKDTSSAMVYDTILNGFVDQFRYDIILYAKNMSDESDSEMRITERYKTEEERDARLKELFDLISKC